MKITELRIDRFGGWRDLALPLSPDGVNVVYGPNEAGKTTLLEFIRAVLYGRDAQSAVERFDGEVSDAWSGSLSLEHRGRRFNVSRRGNRDGSEQASIESADGSGNGARGRVTLDELLGGADPAVFKNVFAVGLSEIQELATLEGDDVAEHIYGLTLGPAGRKLIYASEAVRAEQERRRWTEPDSGRIPELLEREAGLKQKLRELEDRHREYAADCHERDGLDARIRQIRERHANVQHDLRARRFLERVWSPWRQVQELREESAALPAVPSFPDGGIQHLDELDGEIAGLTESRRELADKLSKLDRRAEELDVDPELARHEAAARVYIDQRDWITEIENEHVAAEAEARNEKSRLDQAVSALGSDWNAGRLEAVDDSPAAVARMMDASRSYRAALSARKRCRAQLDGANSFARKRADQLEERLKSLGDGAIDAALETEQSRLADVEELGRLRLREAALRERERGLSNRINRTEARMALPPWIFWVFVFFGVGGLLVLLLGVVYAVRLNVFAGTAYALLGATGAAMAWAWRNHWLNSAGDGLERVRDEYRRVEGELRETREALARLSRRTDVPGASSSGKLASTGDAAAESALIRRTVERIRDLEELQEECDRDGEQRRSLSEMRSRFQVVQREVSESRQKWCEALKAMGLGETVRIDEAFANWQKIAEAARQQRRTRRRERDLARARRDHLAVGRRMTEISHRLNCEPPASGVLPETLTIWETRLEHVARCRNELIDVNRQIEKLTSEADKLTRKFDEFESRRSMLFSQGGAETREQFEQRAVWYDRRRELDELLELADDELNTVAGLEPDLAIVEEDLTAYVPQDNANAVKTLERESEALAAELEQASTRLGEIRRTIFDFERDRTPDRLQFARNMVRAQLKDAGERLVAADLAGRTIDRMRTRFERNCQPDVLSAASGYLERLTDGRYTNLWSPLGERRLRVDDRDGAAWGVEQLSRGTREQVFLAVRLALVRQFAADGVHLPLVLDDVLVNFDLERTEAAAETLMDFARADQQLLFFTCHAHLADYFVDRGATPVELPARTASMQRQAG